MKHTIANFSIVIVLLIVATSCTKEMEYNLQKGNLKGAAYYDGNYSDAPLTVLLEGRDQRKTTVDNTGNYSFNGITSGTYNLKFTKEGFNSFTIYGFPFIGGDSVTTTVPTVSLAQLTNATVSNLKMTMSVDTTYINNYKIVKKTIEWTADFNSSTNYMAYLSSDANVSYRSYKRCCFANNGFNITLYDYDLILFRKGTTLYMVIYPYETLGTKYPDVDTGCLVYSGIQTKGASNVASVIVK